MFKRNYNTRLFFVLFGISVIVFSLSLAYFLSGFENRVFIGGIILLISLGLSSFLSKKLSEPIEKLNEAVKRISRGDFDYQLNITDSKELRELSENFNSMARD